MIKAQKSSDKITRQATISSALDGANRRKYSGRNPQSAYEATASAMPTVLELFRGGEVRDTSLSIIG
jgi:hypothetical protein